MSDAFQNYVLQGAGIGKSETRYDKLAVQERVVQAGSRTIALENITFLELGEIDGRLARKFGLIFFGAGLTIVTLVLLFAHLAGGALITGAIAGWLFYLAMTTKAEYVFTIATNDGSRTSFIGSNHELMRKAHLFVTWKINSADIASKNYFDFNGNTIVGSQIGGNISNG